MKYKAKIYWLWWPTMLLIFLCGCGPAATAQDSPARISLAIEGYNYTNRYIDSFSVDGHGGGNIYLSSPTSGGGGAVCCVSFYPTLKTGTVKVRWQSDACYFSEQSSLSKKMFDSLHPLFKEQDVPVEVLATSDAKYMEVHFYPDGSIKAAITSSISPPRLLLKEERKDQTRYPRCPNDRRPQE